MDRSSFAVFAACLLFCAPGAAQDKWGAHIDFEAKPGTKRSLGEADLFVPLMQDSRTLLFGNLRARLDDDSNREGNLGLGVRRMYDGGWNLGGYGYFDRRKTENGNYFNQATFGGEALGLNWDLRANVYLPYGDREKELGTESSASLAANTVVVSTVTSEERALKGFDAEVGWRVPLFAADRPSQLRVYAGGYRFEDGSVSLSGPRLRAELAMTELRWLWNGAQLLVSAEAQDDDVRGSQAFLSLRLRVPLGGKETPRGLSVQERRMTAPVVRDVDIVASVVTRAPVIETATATADGQALAILDSGTTLGSALQSAVAAAGPNSTVVLTGTYDTTSTTQLQNGQTLMGAGSLQVRTPSGYTATLTTPGATINGNIPGSGTVATVSMASNSVLKGMTLTHFNTTNDSATVVRATGVSNVLIENNSISASSGGLALSVQGVLVGSGSTGAIVRNNTINVTTGTNVQNLAGVNAGPGSFGTVLISGNSITITGDGLSKHGIDAAGGVPGGTIATITGNTVSVTGPGGTNRAFAIVNTAVAPGSVGNVVNAGICTFVSGGSSGSIGFTDGTTCP